VDVDNARSISGVTHAAGEDFATLALSSPLDASSDIDSDTLAAATASSIYDAGGRAMGTDQVLVRGDAAAPTMSGMDPAHQETGVSSDSDLTFYLGDTEAGVDWTTFQIVLTGDDGYSETYTDADTGIVSKSGTRWQYSVTIDPDSNFAAGEVITPTVSAMDLVGNALVPPAWTFTVAGAATPQTVYLHPSGMASNSGGYWTVPAGTPWETVLDTNDGDSTYVTSNTGAMGATYYMAIDDPSGLAGATIQSVKVHVLARYVSGWAPDPPAYSGNVKLGYKTGTATQWTGDILVSGSSYMLVSSDAYALDSDGGGLDLADINNLQVAVQRRLSGGYPLRNTEMYAEVTYLPAAGGSPMFGQAYRPIMLAAVPSPMSWLDTCLFGR
jgi:hypothetical protein